jgi:hypothetical protein
VRCSYHLLFNYWYQLTILVGYNIPTAGLWLEILQVIISLLEDPSMFSNLSPYVSFHLFNGEKLTHLSDSYTDARTWKELIQAVCKSTVGSPAENLVQLYRESEVPVSSTPAEGITRVIYKNIHDIPRLLTNPPPSEGSLVCAFAFAFGSRSFIDFICFF